MAKAIYDNKLLDAYFTRSFYKHILGKPVKVSDMEAEDYSFYQGLVYLLEHDIDEIGVELSFSTDVSCVHLKNTLVKIWGNLTKVQVNRPYCLFTFDQMASIGMTCARFLPEFVSDEPNSGDSNNTRRITPQPKL